MNFMSRDIAEIAGQLFFYSPEKRVLLRMDTESARTQCVEIAGLGEIDYLDRIVAVGNKLFANTINGKYLVEIDIGQSVCRRIPLGFNQGLDRNVAGIFTIGNRAVVVGAKNKRVFILERDASDGLTIDLPVDDQSFMDVISCKQDGQRIVIVPRNGKQIVVFDGLKNGFEKAILTNAVTNVTCCRFDDKKLYLLQEDGTILSFDSDYKVCCHQIYPSCREGVRYGRFLVMKNSLLRFCSSDGTIERLCKQTGELLDTYCSNDEKVVPKERAMYARYDGFCETNKHFYFANRVYKKYLRINKETEMPEWYEPLFPETSDVMQCQYASGYRVLYEEKDLLEGLFSVVIGHDA